MSNIKISIIIPVYNTEKYIKKCLNSIVKQSIDNIEIIIVNDGSPDKSDIIIKEFEKKYNNIIYLVKENGGLSSARNLGLSYATGEYIGFIDSDDYVKEDMYLKLYTKAIEEDADIVICDMKYDKNGEDISGTCFEDFGTLNKYEAMSKYLEHNYFKSHAQNKIYKKKLFNNIRFPEGKLFEDVATFYKLVDQSERVSFVNEKLYIYNQDNSESITKKKFNLKNLELLMAWEEMHEYLRENNYKEDIINRSIIMYYKAVKVLVKMLYCGNSYISSNELKDIKAIFINNINKNIYNKGRNLEFKTSNKGALKLIKKYLNNINCIFTISLLRKKINKFEKVRSLR